nr:glutamine synthetase [Streptomyces sp. RLB1-33]
MNDQTVKQSCQAPHPSGLLSPDQLRAAVQSGEITTVMLAVPDMMGRLKGKRLSASVFLDRMLSKSEACAYILATDVDMTPLKGFDLTGWNDGYGDLSVIPSQDTIRVLPYLPGAALIHADVADEAGELLEIAPRHMLRTQLDKLAALGLEVRVGLESEFVLYQGSPLQAHAARYRALQPVAFHNLDYALDHPPALTDFFQHLEDALHGAGTPVESVKTEGAPGQLEITFPYGPAMTACDAYTVYKHAVRHIAQRRGMTPTFMAAPQTGVGSGLHIHLSLLDVADYRNAFATRPNEEELPETMQRAIAGLISAMPYLAPLYAPHANSYKRYNPHSFAPTRFTWGYDNRSCAIRVTGHGTGRHLEVRLPGEFSDRISVRVVVDLRGDVAWMSGTVGWPLSSVGSFPKAGPLSPGLLQFEDLGFEVGDALVGEPVVGASAFESFLEPTVFLGELKDASLECGVLGDDGLDGFAGDHLLGVADLPHQLTDLLSLGVYFLLRAGQFCFGVQRPFSPGGFDPVVCFFGGAVVTALAGGDGFLDQVAGVGVVVEERGRHVRPVSDGPDGEASSFATQLSDGLLDLAELDLCLSTAGSNGCLGLAGAGGHGRSS